MAYRQHQHVPDVGGAAMLIVPFAWRFVRNDLQVLRSSWPRLLLLALLGVAAFDALNYLALGRTPALNALLLQSAIPVLIVGFSFVLFGDRVTWRQALGLLLSLAGAVAIVTEGDVSRSLELGATAGTLLAFVAVLCYSAYSSLLSRRPAMHPISFLAVVMVWRWPR